MLDFSHLVHPNLSVFISAPVVVSVSKMNLIETKKKNICSLCMYIITTFMCRLCQNLIDEINWILVSMEIVFVYSRE